MAEFTTLKEKVSIEQVAQMLNLTTIKPRPFELRAKCPTCGGGPKALSMTIAGPHKGKFRCYVSEEHGDIIALVAHAEGLKPEDAGNRIAKHFGIETVRHRSTPQPPEKVESAEGPEEPEWFANLELDPMHESVKRVVGISPVVADELRIGFSEKGTMPQRVLIPIRRADGFIIGCAGVPTKPEQDPMWLFPKNLQDRAEGNVVQYRRK